MQCLSCSFFQVVEKFLPASHSFLSIVFAQISWTQWISSLNPKFIGKGHAMLLNLTVRLGNDTVAREVSVCITKLKLEILLNTNFVKLYPCIISSHQLGKK